MDVRNVNKNLVPVEISAKSPVQKTIKSDTTSDRDGNGQTPYERQDQKKNPPMTQEICEKAARLLEALDSIKDSSLKIKTCERGGRYFIEIYDSTDQLVRSLNEQDIWLFFETREAPTGNLLNKVA